MPTRNSAACISDVARRLVLWAACVLVAPAALAETTQVRVFDLQYRNAEELIAQVRPLVDAEGAVSGSGRTLVIRSSLQNLAELEKVLESLDRPRRQLMVTVRQGGRHKTVHRDDSLEGSLRRPEVRVYATESAGEETIAQRLRVSDGQWAEIRAGEAIPVPQQTINQGPGGTTVQQSIEYRDLDTGYRVRPRLTGSSGVEVDIQPFFARRAAEGGGIIEQQGMESTLTGRLGEWIEVGGGIDTRLDDRRGTIYSTKERERLTRSIFLRIDLVSP